MTAYKWHLQLLDLNVLNVLFLSYNFILSYLDAISSPVTLLAEQQRRHFFTKCCHDTFHPLSFKAFLFHTFMGQWLMQYIRVSHLNEGQSGRSTGAERREKLQSFSFRSVHSDLGAARRRVRKKTTLVFSDCFFYSARLCLNLFIIWASADAPIKIYRKHILHVVKLCLGRGILYYV